MEPTYISPAEAAAAEGRPRPPPHALGPFFVLGVKESQHKEVKPATAASSAAAAFSGVPGLKGEQTAENKDGGVEGAAAGGFENGDGAKVNQVRKIAEGRQRYCSYSARQGSGRCGQANRANNANKMIKEVKVAVHECIFSVHVHNM